MSFLDFTLVPGGSFIMTESIGAFDDNVPAPDVPVEEHDSTDVPIAASPEETPVERLRKRLSADKDRNAVVEVTNDLRDVYQGIMIPTINRQLDQYQPEEIARVAEEISNDTSAAIHVLMHLIEKVRCMTKLYDNSQTRNAILYAPVRDNLGFLIKHLKDIEQDGFESMQIHFTYHPAFEEYSVNQIASAILNAPDVLKHDIITLETLERIVGRDAKICTMFRDVMDMLNTMLSTEDAAVSRRIRQETTNSYSYHLAEIIKWNIPNDSDCVTTGNTNENSLLCRMTKSLSICQRKIKQKCYDVQVACSDMEAPDIKECNQKMYCCSLMLFNMFVVTAAVLLSMAYQANRILTEKRIVEDWIQSILKHYSR